MSEKKSLNQDELKEVNGGLPWVLDREPAYNDFYYHPGDVLMCGGNYLVPGNINTHVTEQYTVTKLGKRLVTRIKNTNLVSYDMYYYLEPVNRAHAQFDGWYDFELEIGSKDSVRKSIRHVSPEGIIVVE